jgi:uncharacterized repeat protein (TIGR01451 family)
MVTVTLRVRVHTAIPPSVEQICNLAVIDSPDTEPVDFEVCRLVGGADLAVVKSDQPDRYVRSGAVLTYTLAYGNLGRAQAQDGVISDTLPNQVTYGGVVAQPPGWSAPPAYAPGPPATLTWTTPTLAAGAQGQIVYTVTVSSEFMGTITNAVCISTTTAETRYDNNCDIEATQVVSEPIVDLLLVKDADQELVRSGELLTYTLAYTNASDYIAENVVVTDSLPAETTFVAADPAPSSTSDPLTWNLGTLGARASGEIKVTVRVRPGITQPFTNLACVSTDTLEESQANNCDIVRTPPADVTIRKSDDPDPVGRAGRQLVYTLVFTNVGEATAYGVVVTDTLPPEVGEVVSTSRPPVSTDPHVWNLGELAPGQSGTIVVTAILDASAGPSVNNRAVISTDTFESNYGNNEDDEPTLVETDLAIVKSDHPDPGVPGGLLTYTLEYANLGRFDAQEVTITDTFPVGITFAEVVQQPPGWQGPHFDAGPPVELTWYRPRLAAGALGRIVYTVLADEDVPAEIENLACIGNAILDYNSDNNCHWEPTAVQLLSFETLRLPRAVLLKWETAWEVDSYGFVLLRRASGQPGEAQEIAFVPAQGRNGGGAAYRYLDAGSGAGLESGTAYRYWLVEVDTSGRRTTFGSALSAAASEFPHQVYLPLSVRP